MPRSECMFYESIAHGSLGRPGFFIAETWAGLDGQLEGPAITVLENNEARGRGSAPVLRHPVKRLFRGRGKKAPNYKFGDVVEKASPPDI